MAKLVQLILHQSRYRILKRFQVDAGVAVIVGKVTHRRTEARWFRASAEAERSNAERRFGQGLLGNS